MGQADQVTYCHRKKMDMARIKVASISIPKCRITVTEGTLWGQRKGDKDKNNNAGILNNWDQT